MGVCNLMFKDVLRNWHSREKKIVQNMQDLVDTARQAAAALEGGKAWVWQLLWREVKHGHGSCSQGVCHHGEVVLHGRQSSIGR